MNIVYVGLNPQTPEWLAAEHRLHAVGDLGEYLLTFSLWPPDMVVQFAYRLQRSRFGWMARVVDSFCSLAYPWCSPVLKRYKPFITTVIQKNVHILNTDDTEGFVAYIKKKTIDLLVINAWSILPASVIEAPNLGTINVHPSRLPKYRGALPTLWALKNQDTETAVTFILAGREVDAGKILSQYLIPIAPSEDALSLEVKIDETVKRYLCADIAKYAAGTLEPQPQTGTPSVTAKYQEYQEVRFGMEKVRDIRNKIALYPFLEPGRFCHAKFLGHSIILRRSIQGATSVPPGKFHLRVGVLSVGAIDGSISFRFFKDISIVDSLKLLTLPTTGSLDA